MPFLTSQVVQFFVDNIIIPIGKLTNFARILGVGSESGVNYDGSATLA
jgi:hypothetical protein